MRGNLLDASLVTIRISALLGIFTLILSYNLAMFRSDVEINFIVQLGLCVKYSHVPMQTWLNFDSFEYVCDYVPRESAPTS